MTFLITQRDAVDQRSPRLTSDRFHRERSGGGHSRSLAEVLVDLARRPSGGYIMPDLMRHESACPWVALVVRCPPHQR
jgi:hypothetical protein